MNLVKLILLSFTFAHFSILIKSSNFDSVSAKPKLLDALSKTNHQYADILLIGNNWMHPEYEIQRNFYAKPGSFLNLGILALQGQDISESIFTQMLQKDEPLYIIFEKASFNVTVGIFSKLNHQIFLLPHHQTFSKKLFFLFGEDEIRAAVGDQFNFPDFLMDCKNLLNVNSDVYLIVEGRTTIEVLEMYTLKNVSIIRKIRDPFARKIETDENANFRILNEITRKAPRRTNFRKAVITGAVPRIDNTGRDISYQVQENNVTGEVKFLGGYRIVEYRYLRDVMNFTENATVSNGFASLSSNGTLLGLGQVINDELGDIAIASNEMVPYRVEKLSFLIPSSSETHNAYFRQPPANSVRDIYRQAFSTNLWIGFFAIWVAYAMTTTFIHWSWISFYNSSFYAYNGRSFTKNLFDASENIISTFGVMFQQGWIYSKLQRVNGRCIDCSTSIRLVIIFGLLSSLIFYGAYCASLVSILSIPVNPVKSFQDIVNGDFILYGEKFTLAVDRILTAIIGNKSDFPALDVKHSWAPVQVDNDLIDKLLSSRSAFIAADKSFIGPLLVKTNFSMQSFCQDISSVPLGLPISKTGMFVKKHSPLKEYFNYQILKMFEFGIRYRTEGQYLMQTTINCVAPRSKIITIGLQDSFTAFILHAIGLGISIISLGLEILLSKMRISTKSNSAIFQK